MSTYSSPAPVEHFRLECFQLFYSESLCVHPRTYFDVESHGRAFDGAPLLFEELERAFGVLDVFFFFYSSQQVVEELHFDLQNGAGQRE